ncbi:MAG TPA: carboxypeptidase-like regulatory domain-containing protein, partial [Acidimicrobiales bacterium]|nr:carboxypeptidase-like regulatory domain-containing protein [Acidimicrobiales bacterium]
MNLEHRSRVSLSGSIAAGVLTLGALLLPTAAAGEAAESACVSVARFELEPQASLPDGLRGKVILHAKDATSEPLTLSARLGVPVTAELPCASQWEATPDFPNVWGPRRTVVAGTTGAPVVSRLALWPLGKITGLIKLADKGEPRPQKLTVTTLAPRSPARRDTPKGSLDCPVDPTGRWNCPPLPAATFDLVVSAAGFIPQYRWDFTVRSDKTGDLGTLVLKKGASVAGWVEVEGGAIGPDCRASLEPLVGPGSGGRIAEKVRRTTLEATVRKDGFFQIAGVAPGAYSLEVRQVGFAPASVNPISVSPRSETFLRQPITLTRPIDVELAISPPLDWLGRPWKMILFRASGDATGSFDQTIYAGSADEQGKLKVARQTPGTFHALVSDSLDNQLASQIFQITGPEDSSRVIDIKIVTLRGTVKLGKEPLAAELWFGGRRGSTSIKLDADRDGKFQGILPRDGWWVVDISSASPKFEARTRVKVESEGQDRVRADIDLPATRVFGKVVDDQRHPVPDAIVSLTTDQGLMHKEADETGSFDFRGLPEGFAEA